MSRRSRHVGDVGWNLHKESQDSPRPGQRRKPTLQLEGKTLVIWRVNMLHYAVVFLVIALIAAVLGFGGIAAGAAGIAKILFFVFLVIAIVTFFVGRAPRV